MTSSIVLIHAVRSSRTMWKGQRRRLRERGFEVIAPDLPGHGRRRGETFTLEAALATIEEAVAACESPPLLVGLSLGGYLTLHSAARLSTADGDPLGSLVACGAATQPTPRLARLYAGLFRAAEVLPSMRTGTFPFTWLLGVDGARALVRGGRAEIDVLVPAFTAVAGLDLRAELARIPVPVTFLHGRGDQLRLQERSFVAAAPRGRLELLPYGDHMVNLVRPERFTPDLLRVLARAEREHCARSGARA